MVSETVDRIILAERQADEKMESAYHQAEEIMAQASRNARETMDKARQEALAESADLYNANRMEIDEIYKENSQVSIDEASALTVRTRDKKGKAIQMVIAKIFLKQ